MAITEIAGFLASNAKLIGILAVVLVPSICIGRIIGDVRKELLKDKKKAQKNKL